LILNIQMMEHFSLSFHANRNEENDETIAIIKAEITKTLSFVANLKDLEDLMNYCLEHNGLVHHEDIMRYLAIKKDDASMEKYLVKVRGKLQKISDNAYSFYVQKSLKLKEKYASSISN
jgi:prenyltransferase beta subunit